jgi:hypothetical protein
MAFYGEYTEICADALRKVPCGVRTGHGENCNVHQPCDACYHILKLTKALADSVDRLNKVRDQANR